MAREGDMAVVDVDSFLTFVTEIATTTIAAVATVTAGIALTALGTVGASSAFLALPVLVPAVLVGSVSALKLVHAGMLHTSQQRQQEKKTTNNSWFGNLETAPATLLRNHEFVSSLVLGGVTAGTAAVANHTAPYAVLNIAGGLSAGLAVASLSLAISALHDAYFAWSYYQALDIPQKETQEVNNQTLITNLIVIRLATREKEIMRRATHSSLAAAFGWTAVTAGSVAAAMSFAPMLVAVAFLLGGITITGARLYNDGFNFGLFNKGQAASASINIRHATDCRALNQPF